MFSHIHRRILFSLRDDDLRKGSKEATREEFRNRHGSIERHPYAVKWAEEIKEKKKVMLEDPLKSVLSHSENRLKEGVNISIF
ncbi:MAG: hypothetical protein ACP5QH_03975 [Thermoplasmata archaeon]